MVYMPHEHDGSWVDEGFYRLSEVIKDYDSSLDLRWIPPDKRTRNDKKPWVIWDTVHNHAVLYAGPTATPTEILEDLFMGDNAKGNVMERLEARNRAREIMDLKSQMDVRAQAIDEATFLVKTKKNFIKHKVNGELVKLDDQLRRI